MSLSLFHPVMPLDWSAPAPTDGEPAREVVSSHPVDSRRIERQLAKAWRWRHPSWSAVCRALERSRQRRPAVADPQLCVNTAAPAAAAGQDGWRARLRRRGWLASALVHALLLGGLAWVGMAPTGHPPLATLAVGLARSAGEEWPSAMLLAERPPGDGLGSSEPARPEPAVRPPAIALAPVADRSAPVGEIQPIGETLAKSLVAKPPPEPFAGAEFFGLRAGGNRFVFVIDCSRSMVGRSRSTVGTRWDEAVRELTAALERLNARQSFYVIFFDGESHPMFDDRAPELTFLPADEPSVERFRRWLPRVRWGAHTRPGKALERALQLRPDAIFLLADDEIQDQTAALLREQNWVRVGRERRLVVPVHTISLHSQQGQETLRRIAAENGGAFRFVPEVQVATGEVRSEK